MNDPKRKKIKTAVLAIAVALLLPLLQTGCYPDYNAPDDHMISQHGVMHKEGLQNPESNCVSCHGTDLQGGDVGVSCFKCHDKKW